MGVTARRVIGGVHYTSGPSRPSDESPARTSPRGGHPSADRGASASGIRGAHVRGFGFGDAVEEPRRASSRRDGAGALTDCSTGERVDLGQGAAGSLVAAIDQARLGASGPAPLNGSVRR